MTFNCIFGGHACDILAIYFACTKTISSEKIYMAYINGGHKVPDGSLLMDCQNEPLADTIACAVDRKRWNARVMNLT